MVGSPLESNLYSYAQNTPVMRKDPSGLQDIPGMDFVQHCSCGWEYDVPQPPENDPHGEPKTVVVHGRSAGEALPSEGRCAAEVRAWFQALRVPLNGLFGNLCIGAAFEELFITASGIGRAGLAVEPQRAFLFPND